MMNRTILLVEDNPDDVLLLRRAFEKWNLNGIIHVVKDGDEAVAYLSGQMPFHDRNLHPTPALVLLDLSLPRRSGSDVLRWLKRETGDLGQVPVVVLTSSKDQSDIDKAYSLGANSYLLKTPDLNGTVDIAKIVDTYWVVLNRKPSAVQERARG